MKEALVSSILCNFRENRTEGPERVGNALDKRGLNLLSCASWGPIFLETRQSPDN